MTHTPSWRKSVSISKCESNHFTF